MRRIPPVLVALCFSLFLAPFSARPALRFGLTTLSPSNINTGKYICIYIASLCRDSRGGGGYWINPGVGRKDFWFFGWRVQREINKRLTLGVEISYETPQETGSEHNLAFNAGPIIKITENHHTLMSAGTDISGPVDFLSHIACQLTFGPEKEKGEVAKH